MHPTVAVGVTRGQFDDMIFAYDTGIERLIVLEGMDLHFFTKKNDVRCLTIHTKYFTYAIYDYNLCVVCKEKKRRLIKITPKGENTNQGLTIYLNGRTA